MKEPGTLELRKPGNSSRYHPQKPKLFRCPAEAQENWNLPDNRELTGRLYYIAWPYRIGLRYQADQTHNRGLNLGCCTTGKASTPSTKTPATWSGRLFLTERAKSVRPGVEDSSDFSKGSSPDAPVFKMSAETFWAARPNAKATTSNITIIR